MGKSTSSTGAKAPTTAPKQAAKARLERAPQHEYAGATDEGRRSGALERVAMLRRLLDMLEHDLLAWPVASDEWAHRAEMLGQLLDATSRRTTKKRACHSLVTFVAKAASTGDAPASQVAACQQAFGAACPEYAAALRAPAAARLLELALAAWGVDGPKPGRPKQAKQGAWQSLFQLAEEVGIAPPDFATFKDAGIDTLHGLREWEAYKSELAAEGDGR